MANRPPVAHRNPGKRKTPFRKFRKGVDGCDAAAEPTRFRLDDDLHGQDANKGGLVHRDDVAGERSEHESPIMQGFRCAGQRERWCCGWRPDATHKRPALTFGSARERGGACSLVPVTGWPDEMKTRRKARPNRGLSLNDLSSSGTVRSPGTRRGFSVPRSGCVHPATCSGGCCT